jgi:hypothetical protein
MGATFAYCAPGEAAVARRLIAAILAGGNSVSLNDGGAWTVRRATDATVIEAAMNTVEEEVIVAFAPDGTRLGRFTLIYGNAEDGSELIADCTANPYCEVMCAEVGEPEGDPPCTVAEGRMPCDRSPCECVAMVGGAS